MRFTKKNPLNSSNLPSNNTTHSHNTCNNYSNKPKTLKEKKEKLNGLYSANLFNKMKLSNTLKKLSLMTSKPTTNNSEDITPSDVNLTPKLPNNSKSIYKELIEIYYLHSLLPTLDSTLKTT